MSRNAAACASPSFVYRDDCKVAYAICSVTAVRQAKAYYEGRGPTLDAIAMRQRYGYTNIAAADGAYAGCFAALETAYRHLLRASSS